MVIGAYLRERFNLDRKAPAPEPTAERTIVDHSMDRPPEAFRDSPPGQVIEPIQTEEQHDC